MEQLPHDWLALSFLVFSLGIRHGLDADHLAAIDGLTRFSAQQRPRLARWCGSLFSLGHGAVVVAIALTVGALARRKRVEVELVSERRHRDVVVGHAVTPASWDRSG